MDKNVLVIDDQSEARALVKMVLQTERYRFHEAANGEQAMGLLIHQRPDCVIVDVRMPGALDGYAVCRMIKNDPGLCNTPVIILSAFCDDQAQLRGKIAGADAYIGKPFNFFELVDLVENLIHGSGTSDANEDAPLLN